MFSPSASRLSLDVPQDELPRFLRMLFTMVSDPACDTVIRWAHEGTAFQILDADCLSFQVLAVYYTPQKFSSFQRQLNYFGFRKWTKTQTDVCTFSHPEFLEYDQDRLWQIRRGKRSAPSPSHFATPKTTASSMSWSQVATPRPRAASMSWTQGATPRPTMSWGQGATPKPSPAMKWVQAAAPKPSPAIKWVQSATPKPTTSMSWSQDIPRLSITKKEPIRKSTVGFKRSLSSESVQPKKMFKAETEMALNLNFGKDLSSDFFDFSDDQQFNELLQTLTPSPGDTPLFDNESASCTVEDNVTDWLDVLLQDDVVENNDLKTNNSSETLDFDWKSFLNTSVAHAPAC